MTDFESIEQKLNLILRNQVAINARLQQVFKMHHFPNDNEKERYRNDHDHLEDSMNELLNSQEIIKGTDYLEEGATGV